MHLWHVRAVMIYMYMEGECMHLLHVRAVMIYIYMEGQFMHLLHLLAVRTYICICPPSQSRERAIPTSTSTRY